MSATMFVGDNNFCPDCGSVLPLLRAAKTVVCCVCNREIKTSVFHGHQTYSKVEFNNESMKSSNEKPDLPDGPMVDRKCTKCGHEGMTYATMQTRSADEGQTVFYTCPQCRSKEIENS